jgi:hypothetical protein
MEKIFKIKNKSTGFDRVNLVLFFLEIKLTQALDWVDQLGCFEFDN